MSGRDTILAALRAARPQGDFPLPALPAFPLGKPDLRQAFETAFIAMGGKPMEPPADRPLADIIAGLFPAGGRFLDTTGSLPGWPGIASIQDARDLAGIELTVTRARFGVAETGSVFLSDRELGINASAYLAQHLVVLLDPAALVAGIADAYARPDFAEVRYASLTTGPSATADIEGVLIRGAQGVRSLTLLWAPP